MRKNKEAAQFANGALHALPSESREWHHGLNALREVVEANCPYKSVLEVYYYPPYAPTATESEVWISTPVAVNLGNGIVVTGGKVETRSSVVEMAGDPAAVKKFVEMHNERVRYVEQLSVRNRYGHAEQRRAQALVNTIEDLADTDIAPLLRNIDAPEPINPSTGMES